MADEVQVAPAAAVAVEAPESEPAEAPVAEAPTMAVGDFCAERALAPWQARVFLAFHNLQPSDVKPLADLERDLAVALHGGI